MSILTKALTASALLAAMAVPALAQDAPADPAMAQSIMAADGISLRAPGFCNVNQLFDANSEQASRIEVIKGPPTALYGTNAMHGVINILSAPPSEQSEHFFALEAGPAAYLLLANL